MNRARTETLRVLRTLRDIVRPYHHHGRLVVPADFDFSRTSGICTNFDMNVAGMLNRSDRPLKRYALALVFEALDMDPNWPVPPCCMFNEASEAYMLSKDKWTGEYGWNRLRVLDEVIGLIESPRCPYPVLSYFESFEGP